MVLGGRPPGRVGRRRISVTSAPAAPTARARGRSSRRGPRSARRYARRHAPTSGPRRAVGAPPIVAVVEAPPSQRTAPSGGADGEAVAATSATRSSGSAARKGRVLRAADEGGRRLLAGITSATHCAYSDRCATRSRTRRACAELLGLAEYRVGHYQAAAKELEAFVELSRSVEQHRLMDCYRRSDGGGRSTLARAPGAEVVTEGRPSPPARSADRGRIDEAISLLTRADKKVSKPKPYHLRLWYALPTSRSGRQRAPRPGAVRPGPPRGRRVRRRRRAAAGLR